MYHQINLFWELDYLPVIMDYQMEPLVVIYFGEGITCGLKSLNNTSYGTYKGIKNSLAYQSG